MLTAAFTANNRPWYMRQVLDSWRAARGVENIRMEFYPEPECGEMIEVCRSASFAAETTVEVHPYHRGVQASPFIAISSAFNNGAQFVILGEDDLVVSDDVLEFFTFASAKWADDPSVLLACAHQHEEQPGGVSGVRLVPWFQGWIWGTWRDRWENLLAPDWTSDYRHGGWDTRISDYWVAGKGMTVAAPCLSRSQHIGRAGGTHMHEGIWEQTLSKCFTPAVPPHPWEHLC